MDIRIFDNFEDDGQLTLFGLEEDFEEIQTSAEEPAKEAAAGAMPERELRDEQPQPKETASGGTRSGEMVSEEQPSAQAGAGIRIRSCSSCGKLLFVREEDGGYVSACNACGIQYAQK